MSWTILRTLQAAAEGPGIQLSRREALRAALAGAGGLMCLDLPCAAAQKKDLPRVIVVGAGFAGLACADELAAAGYEVTVLEARDRVGGRVQTLRDLVEGKTVEAGGELVGPNQPTWMAYAKRFGLKFVEMSWDPSDTIVLDGQAMPAEQAKATWEQMRSALVQLNALAEPIDAYRPWLSPDALRHDRRSLDDWIRRLDATPTIRRLITIQMTGINGLIPAWQSLLGILAIVKGGGLQKFWDETDSTHCVGGTQQLAEHLGRSFVGRAGEKQLRLSTPVHRIEVNDEGVIVQLANGLKLTADDLVLTAPPTTWNKIAFDPPLPGELIVPMAASTKWLAVVKERIWARLGRQHNAMSTGPVQITWEATAGQGEEGQHALVAFGGGREADEARGWPASERERRYREALTQLFPGFGEVMVGGRFVDWVSDPWARGTYSFPAPGQVTTVGPILDKGLGHLHFAGEHCSYAFVGWMEGALSSGVRMARKLAERDGVVKPAAKKA